MFYTYLALIYLFAGGYLVIALFPREHGLEPEILRRYQISKAIAYLCLVLEVLTLSLIGEPQWKPQLRPFPVISLLLATTGFMSIGQMAVIYFGALRAKIPKQWSPGLVIWLVCENIIAIWVACVAAFLGVIVST